MTAGEKEHAIKDKANMLAKRGQDIDTKEHYDILTDVFAWNSKQKN